MGSDAIRNVHQRRFAAEADHVGELLARLGGPDDDLWPKDRWPAIVVPHPIAVGDVAGHGGVRYFVDEYRPGEALWFRFDPASGLVGRHGLTVERCDDGVVALTHILEGHAVGKGRVLWPLMIRATHDQLLEELMDNAERLLPGLVRPIPERHRRQLDGRSRWGLAVRATFAGVNRLRSVPRPAAHVVAVSGLGGAAALHALWATGTNWPGVDRADLARKVVGGSVFPSDSATWTVVALLVAATGFTAMSVRRSRNRRIDGFVTTATAVVAAVLALRAVGGVVASASSLVSGHRTPFAPRDLLIYSPLCAVLAVASGALAIQRTPDPMA